MAVSLSFHICRYVICIYKLRLRIFHLKKSVFCLPNCKTHAYHCVQFWFLVLLLISFPFYTVRLSEKKKVIIMFVLSPLNDTNYFKSKYASCLTRSDFSFRFSFVCAFAISLSFLLYVWFDLLNPYIVYIFVPLGNRKRMLALAYTHTIKRFSVLHNIFLFGSTINSRKIVFRAFIFIVSLSSYFYGFMIFALVNSFFDNSHSFFAWYCIFFQSFFVIVASSHFPLAIVIKPNCFLTSNKKSRI